MKTVDTPTQKFPEMTPIEQPAQRTGPIVLCPGQGAQAVGMGQGWFNHAPAAKRYFEAADNALGYSLSGLCFNGPADKLNRTDHGQVGLYVTGVASYESLVEAGTLEPVSAAAGLSLGEFTALYIAGAFDFRDGLELVRIRGQAMQDAAEAVPSGMLALVGADEDAAAALCDRARGDGVLVPANFNCPGQIVLSGDAAACQRALDAAAELGVRATPLKVAGAFHSPLMKPAADRLAEALDNVSWSAPRVAVVSNVTAAPHPADDTEAIKARLVEQLTSPVRWTDSMRWLLDHDPGPFVELAPGNVLSGLMRRIERKQKVTNYAEPA